MKLSLISVSALALIAGSAAYAQDLYIGGEIGLTDHSATFEDRDYDWYGHTQDFDTTGLSFGGYVGKQQIDRNRLTAWELGLRLHTNDDQFIYSSDVQVDTELTFSASLTRSIGFAVDGTSLYVLGGVGVSNTERAWTEYLDVSDTWPDLGATKAGLVLGFGLERQLNERWSVRGQFTSTSYADNLSINGDDYPLYIRDRVNALSIGFTYSLGDNPTESAAPADGMPASFEGSYVGAGFGLASRNVSQSDVDYDYWGGSYDIANDGAIGSLGFGRNWQNGATVLGIEAQLQTGGLSESVDHDFGSFTSETDINAIANLRAKAGVAIGNSQMYVFGGLSSADVDNVMEQDASGRYTGLTVGAGVESFASDRLSWSAEASYTMYTGKEDTSGSDYFGTADMLQISFGVKYHLGAEGRTLGTGALASTHDWSGAYYGVDLAFLANQGTIHDVDYYWSGGDFDLISLGAGVGGHVGKNWQDGSFVYGTVADLAFYSNSEERSAFSDYRSELNAMGSLRGRAGIATGASLLYVTGGLAIADSTLVFEDGGDVFDTSDTRIGGVVGLGVEHAMSDSTSFKAEALFAKFNPTDGFNGDDCSGPVGFDGGDCNMSGYDTNMSIKAGMSFKF